MRALALVTTTLTALVAASGAGSAGNPQPAPGVPAGLTRCTQGVDAWCGAVLVPLDRSGRVPGTTPVRFEYYPRTADRSTAADRRAAWIGAETLADVVDRWYPIPGTTGPGLYGGKFTITSTAGLPFTTRVWSLKLNHVKWTTDVEVTGAATVPPRGRDRKRDDLAGRLGDGDELTRPAPSHW